MTEVSVRLRRRRRGLCCCVVAEAINTTKIIGALTLSRALYHKRPRGIVHSGGAVLCE